MKKVTIGQQNNLVSLWAAGKTKEVARLQRELGVSSRYASNVAANLGISRRRKRWELAKARGSISV